MTISRRAVLTGMAVTPFANLSFSEVAEAEGSFEHGVASGDPDSSSVVIWTRVTTSAPSLTVLWEVAADAAFTQILASGKSVTNVHRDHTVKQIVSGLQPGKTYFYRFKSASGVSPVGKTRTLPVGEVARLGLAVVSCSNYAFGHFNAYRAIADDAGIEFVLHLGDYIYEYGADGWGQSVAAKIGREHVPAHEIVSLQDYRQRHAQYKADPDSIAMHAAHPLLLVWDDHESANNPWVGGAQNHQPRIEGDWRDRRHAAIQAYYEWMPVREPNLVARRRDFWREYTFGNLASLLTLESRHTARAEQISYAAHLDQIDSAESARAFEREVLGAPGRKMLSDEMNAFAEARLRASQQRGTYWRLLGNAIPMAKMPVPDLTAHGLAMPGHSQAVPGSQGDLMWKGKFNLPFYLDTWDGYPWAREQFYQLCQRAGVNDLVVLTGDSHSFWANQLFADDGAAMGVEIGTAGVSSPGDFVEQGFAPDIAAQIDTIFANEVPEVRWTDNLHQGFVRLEITPESIATDFVSAGDVRTGEVKVEVIRSERLMKLGETVVYR